MSSDRFEADALPGLSAVEDLDAERFEHSLGAIQTGRDPGVDPIEDPQLSGLLDTADDLGDAMSRVTPRRSYWVRSRALLLEAMEPSLLRRVARASSRRIPFYDRRSFLVPVAAAAAAAGLTIAVMLATGAIDTRSVEPEAPPVTVSDAEPAQSAPATTANLTQLSIQQDLDRLSASLDAVVAAAERGDDVDPRVLRNIAQSNLMVTNLIEGSPDRLHTDEVIVYFQTAARTVWSLNELESVVGEQPELVAARSSSEGGVKAAAAHLVNVERAGQSIQ